MTKKQRKKLKAKQVKAFIDLGYPEAMGISEKKFKKLVPLPENKPRAVLVVSPKAVSIFTQLRLAKFVNYLDLAKLKDVVETPEQSIYWIYNVEDGARIFAKSPKDCRKIFKKQNRRGLTVVETIALFVQDPRILENHLINISGSCYGSDNVPYLSGDSNRPVLDDSSGDLAHPFYGSASCGS